MAAKRQIEWKQVLVKCMGVKDAKMLGSLVANDRKALNELIEAFSMGDVPFRMKAAWVLSHAAGEHPENLKSAADAILTLLEKETVSGTLRELLKALTLAGVPLKWEGRLIDIAFRLLNEMHHDVAVRYNAMKLLEPYILKHTELKDEYFDCLDAQIELNTPTWQCMALRIKANITKKLAKQR